MTAIAEVRQLRAERPLSELEKAYFGGVVDLVSRGENAVELLDSAGLGREDFIHERIGVAVDVLKGLAAQQLPLAPENVVAAGAVTKKLADSDLVWMRDAAAGNSLDRPQLLHLAEKLRVQSRARLTARALREELRLIESGSFDPGRTSGALNAIGDSLARDFVPEQTAADDLVSGIVRWDEHAEAGTSELDPTGIKVLDDAIGGGTPQKLILLAGSPGSGKTGEACSIIKAQLELDAGAAFEDQSTTGVFGLEDGTDWLWRRWAAEGTGLKLNEIGWKKLEPGPREQLGELANRLHPLLDRIVTYNRSSIRPRELIRIATNWILKPRRGRKKGVKRIFVDHLGELDYSDEQAVKEYWRQVGEAVRMARDLANRFHVPFWFLVHDTDDSKGKREGPPNPEKLAGGRSLDRKARLILGAWNHGGPWGSWRMTVLKNTGGENGATVEFERIYNAAMVTPTGGRIVDLEKEATEAAAERERVKEDKSALKKKQADAERREKRRRDREEKEREQAAALERKKASTPAPPQLALIPEGAS